MSKSNATRAAISTALTERRGKLEQLASKYLRLRRYFQSSEKRQKDGADLQSFGVVCTIIQPFGSQHETNHEHSSQRFHDEGFTAVQVIADYSARK
jgi:hypothetical protein